MADLHSRYRLETATLWEVSDVDSAGDSVYATPRTIQVRWEQQATSFLNNEGQSEKAAGYVIVGEDLNINDILFRGTSTESNPGPVTGTHRILGFAAKTSPSGRFTSRVAFLAFRRNL